MANIAFKELLIYNCCGHRRDNEDAGFFPYTYIFKPPGSGGALKKRNLSIPVTFLTLRVTKPNIV